LTRVYRLILWPEAELEVAEAVNWYESQEKGFGRRFLIEFRAATARLRRSPFQFQIVEEQARRVVLHRFPYGVFYEIHDADVVILACLHTSRDPGGWRDRISRSR
jgi:toxin ParE1/3/4